MRHGRTFQAVVYDLDGTLVDSMPMVLQAFAYALEPYLPPLAPMELFARLGGPPDRTFRDLLGNETHAAVAMMPRQQAKARTTTVRPEIRK